MSAGCPIDARWSECLAPVRFPAPWGLPGRERHQGEGLPTHQTVFRGGGRSRQSPSSGNTPVDLAGIQGRWMNSPQSPSVVDLILFSCFHSELQSTGQTAKVLPKALLAVDEPRLGRKYSDNFQRLRATRNGAARGPWLRFRAAAVRRAQRQSGPASLRPPNADPPAGRPCRGFLP